MRCKNEQKKTILYIFTINYSFCQDLLHLKCISKIQVCCKPVFKREQHICRGKDTRFLLEIMCVKLLPSET